MGRTGSPQKILAAVIKNKTEAKMPNARTQIGNCFGRLMSRSAVALSATPAPNEGILAIAPTLGLQSVEIHLRDFRQPACLASCSEQNQRSPLPAEMRVLL